MSAGKFGCVVSFFFLFGWALILRPRKEQSNLDAGQPDPPPQVAESAPRFPRPRPVGVQSSTARSEDPEGYHHSEELVARGDRSSLPYTPSSSTLAEYEDSFLATEEGLFDMTVNLWSQPELLELTQDEAHELLALDDTMGMKGPESMLAIVGPLPDREAVRVAYASRAVQDALWDVVHLDVLIVELGQTPLERRPRWARHRLEEAISMRDAAMLDLMELCEKETGIPTFRTWHRMYRAWTKGMVPSESK